MTVPPIDDAARPAGRTLLWLAMACHVLLATGYLIELPAFEAPDENDHCYYAYHLASTGRLPIILGSAEHAGREAWEEASLGHHPPLYYALLAATMGAVDGGDWAPAWRPNPGFVVEHTDWQRRPDWATAHPGSARKWLHGWDEVAPVSPGIEVLWILRGWSVLFGLASVVLTYALGRLLWPARPAVAGAAALLLACTPQWSMMHGALDNGNLATALGLATLVALVAAVRGRRTGAGTGALLGLLCGLGLATKLTALFLLPVLGAFYAAAWLGWRDRRAALVRSALIAAAVVLATSGWLVVRNLMLYGEPLALGAHRAAYASNLVPDSLRWDWLLGDFWRRAFRSTIGELGWSILPVPVWVLWGFGAVLVPGALAALGGWRSLRRAAGPALWLVVLAIALSVASFVRFNATFFQPQGRYLFPVLGPFLLLVAAGWSVLLGRLPGRLRRAAWLVALLPPALAGWVLAFVFVPAFAVRAGSDDPHWASMVAGLHRPAPALRQTIGALDPADGARSSAPPTFRWSDPGAPADAVYSLHFFTATGRVVITTYEWGKVPIRGHEWTFPAAFWTSIRAGRPLLWKVRRLPDRRRGETVADVPESPPRHLTRVE